MISYMYVHKDVFVQKDRHSVTTWHIYFGAIFEYWLHEGVNRGIGE